MKTSVGKSLKQLFVTAALAAGVLTIDYDIVPDTMSLYQPHQVAKKYAAWPRHQGLHDSGCLAPQTARLRIEELAADLPEASNRYQREGTQARVRAGKNREPTPRVWRPQDGD